MKTSYVTLDPHDPVIARDSRPFGAGIRMKSLDWLYPSVLAGAIRTAIGKTRKNPSFDTTLVKELKDISIHGPLPVVSHNLYFPVPKDILVKDSGGKCDETFAIRPAQLQSNGEGCDLPLGLLPPMLSHRAATEFKPAAIASFWDHEVMASWLINPDRDQFKAPQASETVNNRPAGLDLPKKESRFHSAINRERGVAEDKKLFETIGLDLNLNGRMDGMNLSARIQSAEDAPFGTPDYRSFAPLGGERRLSFMKTTANAPAGWDCPDKVRDYLKTASRIRMVLATPAIFNGGWLPGWIDRTSLCGTPPCIPKAQQNTISLKLVSACIERWKPLSGFSVEKGNTRPKILRRAVPAGAVYFFSVESGSAAELVNCWLQPVSDNAQDCKDGFGLALWGIWNSEQNDESIPKKQVG